MSDKKSKVNNLKLFVTSDELLGEAKLLAEHIDAKLITKHEDGLMLKLSPEGLSLTDGTISLIGDFTANKKRLSANNLNNEMLVKAAKIKGQARGLTLLDATAGMGEDSLLLAAAGFNIKLFESDKVIAALLKDCLRRASDDPMLSDIISRMELTEGDSIAAMKSLPYSPDVILLDPMFPERRKSALVKKKFQLLQQLESPCSDEEELLEAAIKANPRRIVIKRPLKGPYLAGRKPDYSLNGKAIRYDCIVNTQGAL